MRPTQRLEIKVGLLIIVGILATVIMIMVSDKISFERYYRVTAFMTDAAGLRVGSPVTLSGIAIGHIEHILPATDPRGQIKVQMAVLTTVRIPEGSSLELASSGIFGDSSLAFTAPHEAGQAAMATDGSAEVIGKPGFFDEAASQAKGILRSLSGILDEQTATDAKRLVKNAADLAGNGAELAKNLNQETKALGEVLENLRGVTADLKTTMANLAQRSDSIAARIDSTLGTIEHRVDSLSDRLDAAIARMGDLAGHADQLLVDHRADLGVLIQKLRDTATHAASITAAIDSGQGVVGQLVFNRDLAKDVNNLAVDLTVAVEMLTDHPSDLVWGQSKKERAEAQQKRERLKMQRAFKEDFNAPAQPAPAEAAPEK
jgi:phospholipid/cholesterol/gamma-HCH transport system substrate-binding protein